jgi:hypothetical protein
MDPRDRRVRLLSATAEEHCGPGCGQRRCERKSGSWRCCHAKSRCCSSTC